MIFGSVGPGAVFYRFHTPRWSSRPLSGEGAAKQGGRFNRPGVAALYLSSDVATAQAEYQQESRLMPPAVVVTYEVTLANVADLSGGYRADAWGPEWEDWNCDWRALAFSDGIEPPSWVLGDMSLAAGARGILFASLKRAVPGAWNLVVFTVAIAAGDTVLVHDPQGDLPRNQDY